MRENNKAENNKKENKMEVVNNEYIEKIKK